MKKKHIGLRIFLVILTILVVTIVVLAIRFYPVYQAAAFLERNLTLDHMEYSMQAEINRDELEEKQV